MRSVWGPVAGGGESRENKRPSGEAELKHPTIKTRNVPNELASHGGTVNDWSFLDTKEILGALRLSGTLRIIYLILRSA